MAILSFLKKKKKETITTKELPVETTPGKNFVDYGTYNPVTGVYTNPQGQGFSTATPPPGAITVITPGSKSGAGSGGGGIYYPDSGTYINPQGQGFSTATPPEGATISSTSNLELKKSSGLTSQQLAASVSQQQTTEPTKKKKYTGQIVNPDFESYNSGGKIKYRKKNTGVIFVNKKEGTYSVGENVVGGQGFSVAPQYQEQFLQQQAAMQQPTFQAQLPGDVGEILSPSTAEVNYNLDVATRDVQQSSFKEQLIDFAISEKGQSYVGIGLSPGSPLLIKVQDIKKFIQTNADSISKSTPLAISPLNFLKIPKPTKFIIQTAAELIPTTPLDVAITGAGGILLKAPAIIRIPVSSYVSYSGVKGAMSSDLTPQQRVASGVIGVAGGMGALFETIPYGRGIKNIVSVKDVPYVPAVKQVEGFKAIELKETRVGLIPSGYPLKESRVIEFPTGKIKTVSETMNVQLPKTSPLVRGGFQVKSFEKAMFIGKEQTLATSQIGLFKEGVNIPIEREFFTTPQEPFIGIPVTRLSRLGLNEGLFKVPKSSELGFGYPGKPQIGLIKSNVGWKEGAKTFELGKGSELETIKSYGTIQNVKRIGVTAYQSQGIELYSFDIGKGAKTNLNNLYKGTSYKGTRISVEGVLGVSGTRLKETQKTTQLKTSYQTPTIKTLTASTPKTMTLVSVKGVSYSSKTSKGISYKIPSITTSIITPKITTTISPKINYPKTPAKKYPITPPKIPYNYPSVGKSSTAKIFNFYSKPTKSYGGSFTVLMRRFGIFKPVGKTTTLKGAFNLGKFKTRTTLGATFKIEGLKQPKNIFGYKTKPTKKGIYFIQIPKYRLSAPTEKAEIQYYKRMKGGRR